MSVCRCLPLSDVAGRQKSLPNVFLGSLETNAWERSMEASSASARRFQVIRILPYLAVFKADVKQTLRSWIYRAWVLLTVGAATGYLFYRFGAKQVAGIVQPAAEMMSDLLTWVVLGSVTLVMALTAGTICSERGTMADSILSRGISRNQYFLGKWHARLLVVLGTHFLLGSIALVISSLLLHAEQVSITGSIIALVLVGVLLVVVSTFGVAMSAIANTTLVSLVIVWMLLYGGGLLLSWLPPNYPSPGRTLHNLPNIICGFYDLPSLMRLIGASLGLSFVVAMFGMVYFSRRDV